jgi:chaperonin GroEL
LLAKREDMPKPKVVEQPNTTKHLTKGINAMADLLAPTLGPIGGLVANQRDFQRKPELLDDSATAVRRILNLGDPRADVGAMLMRSMVWRVVQRAGDGGATAALLSRALYQDAVRMMAGGANAMRLAKGVNLGVEAAVQSLQAQARKVTNENELANVALTVIHDPSLAAVLGEMSYLLGPDAHVTIEKFVAPYLQQFYHAGATIRAQIGSMYLYTDPALKSAVAANGGLVLIDGKLDTAEEAVAVLQAAQAAGVSSLTIVAGHFSDTVISMLITNSRQGDVAKKLNGRASNGNGTGNSNGNGNGNGNGKEKEKEEESKRPIIIAATPKDVGDARRAVFDDLALATGGEVLGRAWSRPITQIRASDIGRTQRTEVSLELMMITPEQQHNTGVQERCAELRTQLAKMTLDDEGRPLVVQRLAWLNGGMGVLKIGTESKLDREVRAQNAERTLKVLSAAQHTGMVPGGGAAYFHAIPALNEIEAEDDVRFGVQIVQRALEAPLRQILDNAHVPSSSVVMDQITQAGPSATYDVISAKVVDAYEGGVLDVAGVLSTVLRTAASGALMALTTDTIVYHKNPKQSTTP